MKKLILLLFVAFSFNSLSQESNVEWHTDMNKAIEVSMKSKKPMPLMFWHRHLIWVELWTTQIYNWPKRPKWR